MSFTLVIFPKEFTRVNKVTVVLIHLCLTEEETEAQRSKTKLVELAKREARIGSKASLENMASEPLCINLFYIYFRHAMCLLSKRLGPQLDFPTSTL